MFALGANCETNQSGTSSFAIGDSSYTSGSNSMAIGNGCTTGPDGYSFAFGGGCTAIGIGSMAIGQSCRTIGQYSSAQGQFSIAYNDNDRVHAAGYFDNPGDAQTGVNTFAGGSNSVFFLTSSYGVNNPTGFDKVLENGAVYALAIRCVATKANAPAGKQAMWKRDVLAKNVGGTVTIVNENLTLSVPNASGTLWTFNITGTLAGTVTMDVDPQGDNVRAVATVDWTEVLFLS